MHALIRGLLAALLLLGLLLPGATGAAAAPDATAAIQQVIQRSNAEQVQAIATQDSSLMADTLTSQHFAEVAQINQDLLDNGVVSISLVNLEWGPVSVSGATATATTYETWSTSFDDGSTEQSRDRNDYTLVLDGGAWKIQSDVHPDDQAPPPPRAPAAPSPPLPLPDDQNSSHNWSGYAAVGGPFSGVAATWTVPQPQATGTFGTDAAWVGIGGVRGRDLIQAGTQQVVAGSGRTQYQAWVELLPRASQPVPLTVHPGDSISVSLSETAPDSWVIDFTNNTTGQTYEDAEQYHSSHSSVEWVEEAPSTGRGGLLPLDNFGTVPFTDCSATQNGQTVSIAAVDGRPITMVGPNQQPLAVPSALGPDGASFSVDRTDAPSSQPAPTRRFQVVPAPGS